MNNYEVTEKDLNAIDAMNGVASINNNEFPIVNANGEGLKGALAIYNGSFSKYEKMMFIATKKRQLFEYQTERFNYEGLPKELNKYRLEQKTIENGSVLVIKEKGKFYALQYTVISRNIYKEPIKVIVNEPLSSLNRKIYDISKGEGVIFRSNIDRKPLLSEAWRFIRIAESILYHIEKNIKSSAPKGIINPKDTELAFEEDTDSPERDSFEAMINNDNTFFVIKSKSSEDSSMFNGNEEKMFIPIELTDRTEMLIKNFAWVEAQLDKLIGALAPTMNTKKERLTTGENENNGISTAQRQHAYNIRKIDIDSINDLYKLNIVINYQSDDREEVELNESEGVKE